MVSLRVECLWPTSWSRIIKLPIFRMRRCLSFVGLTIVGLCLVVTAYFCHFYYYRYQGVVTRLESSLRGFEMRLGELEAHKSRELTPVRVWAVISTSDRSAYEGLQFFT
jgi:hypothetical protein